MTANERKILKYLWDAKGRAHIKVVAQKVGFTTDYTRLICRSLVRTGYLIATDASVCDLSIKGRNCFSGSRETEAKEPVQKAVNEGRKQPRTVVKKTNGRRHPPAARLDEFKDATPQEREKLAKAGYKSVKDLAAAPVNRLMQDIGVSLKKAADWINQARRKTGMIKE